VATDGSFIHVYEPGDPGAPTVLLLHGTGGNEQSLLGFGRQAAPDWNLLAVRGRSLEEGFPRFFRRFSATRYDQEHLAAEADALAAFLKEAADRYGFPAAAIWALGYSNGANIGVATLARNPGSLRGAALLRGVMPFAEPPAADLSGRSVLLLHGRDDPYGVIAGQLAPWLRSSGADVREHTLATGHGLTKEDVTLSSGWLAQQKAG